MTQPKSARIVLADDEPNLLAALARDIKQLWREVEIVGQARSGREALELIAAHKPDAVFLDIRMPGLSGIDVAQRMDDGIAIVFVTAFDEYAVKAFERAAVDYLLKPVSRDRLALCLERLQSRLQRSASTVVDVKALLAELAPAKRYLQWLRVDQGDRVELVAIEEIVFLRADLKYTSVFTTTREHLLRKPISELEAELDPTLFWRVHRSIIINARCIDHAQRDFRGRFVVRLKNRAERITVSTSHAHLFRQT